MPTHQRKRLQDASGFEDRPRRTEDDDNREEEKEEKDRDDHDDVEAEESDRSSHSSDGSEKEYITVNLSEVRKEVQCAICLGVIRKTRTVMECLHRFCRECIDKSMRLGNNECPSCRTHCASRRSLRDDKNFDKIIAYLYPDIDKYEEEELAFNEADKARSKEIQDNIAKTVKRQLEATVKKRPSRKNAAAEMQKRGRHNLRDYSARGKRNHHQAEETSDDGGRDSSSGEKRYTETRLRRRSKRARGVSSAQPSATNSSDKSSDENSCEENKETSPTVRMLLGSSERLAWGGGGTRSHSRHGNGSAGNVRNTQTNRISKFVDHLKSLKPVENEMSIQIMLVSMDEQEISNSLQPYLSCRPSLTVNSLCRFIALQNAAQADEIEIYVVKELRSKATEIDPSKDELQIVNKKDNLGKLRMYASKNGYVILAYQKKGSNESDA